jgi:hypothetical protein
MKPFTLQVQETEEQLVNTINKSNLPAYVLKVILKGLYQQVEQLEIDEIETYKQQQEKKPKKKESDK